MRSRAASGDVDAVAEICKSYADRRLQGDCFFAASELLPYTLDLYTGAVSLCAGSAMYAHECHGHVLLRLHADDPEPLSAERLTEKAAVVKGFWDARDPGFGAQAVDLYWATAASRAIGTAEPFPVALFSELPVGVLPHLRSAVALRVINEPDPVAAAEAVVRGERADLPKAFMPPVMPAVQVWRAPQPGDLVRDPIFFNDVRGGKRPTSTDPAVDLRIAVLTAVAMRSPPRREVMVSLSETGDLRVRWAARELLGR